MTRSEILKEADRIVNGDRERDYGAIEDSFGTIASFWTEYLGDTLVCPINKVDVATMMALLKIARIKGTGTIDCFVDLAGYAACGGELFNEVVNKE